MKMWLIFIVFGIIVFWLGFYVLNYVYLGFLGIFLIVISIASIFRQPSLEEKEEEEAEQSKTERN